MSDDLRFPVAVRDEARRLGVSNRFAATFHDARRSSAYPALGTEAEYTITRHIIEAGPFDPWTPEGAAAFKEQRRRAREAKAVRA